MSQIYESTDFTAARDTIVVALGSTPTEIAEMIRTLAMERKFKMDEWTKVVAFDALKVEHKLTVQTVDRNLQDAQLLNSEIVKGDIGDEEGRYKAEQNGLLWPVSAVFWKNPMIAGENAGVGGDAASGHVQFSLNQNAFSSLLESCLRNRHDYQQRILSSHQGRNSAEQPVIRVFLLVGFVGGTGRGAFSEVLHILAKLAKALKIKLIITPIVLLMGTINPGDQKKAACNQQMALKNLLARFFGGFDDLHHSNGDFRFLCEPPICISNTNIYGEIASFSRVKSLVANLIHLLSHTPLGASYCQESINFQNHSVKDDVGIAKGGATIGLATVNFNKAKLIEFAAHQYACDSVQNLLEQADDAEPTKRAGDIASSLSLKETAVDDAPTKRLLSLQSKGGMAAPDRAISVFHQRMEHSMGFMGCCKIYHAARHTLDNELVKQLKPAIEAEPDNWLPECSDTINLEVSRYLQQKQGISKARRLLEQTSKTVNSSDKHNNNKLAQEKKQNNSIRATISDYEQIYHKLLNKNWLFRFLSFADKAAIKKEYPQFVESLIHSELRITARTVLSKKVFPAIRKIISDQFARLRTINEQVISTCDSLKYDADRLRNLSADFYCPSGEELATPQLLETKLQELYTSEGGKQQALSKVFDAFVGKFKSQDAFAHASSDVKDFINQYCCQIAVQHLWQLNVFDVFCAAFPDEQRRYGIIEHMIRQSDGKIKISGEGDEEIPKLRYVCAPDPNTVAWAVKAANDIDRRGGDWRGIPIKGISGIVFLQYRTHVSIVQLIRDTSKICEPPRDAQTLATACENPILGTLPFPDCGDAELDRIIVEGVISNMITKNSHGYELQRRDAQPAALGDTAISIRECIAKQYPYIVGIHREFAAHLAIKREAILTKIDTLHNNIQQNPLIDEVGQAGVCRTKEIAEALLPFLKRMPLNGITREE